MHVERPDSYTQGQADAAALGDSLRLSQVMGHLRGAGVSALSSLIGGVATCLALQDALRPLGILVWLPLLGALQVLRKMAGRGVDLEHLQPPAAQRLLWQLRSLTLLHGLLWAGLLGVAKWPPSAGALELLVVALGGAGVAGASVCLLYDAVAAALFALPVAAAITGLLLSWSEPWPPAVSMALAMVGVMGATIVAAGRAMRRGVLELAARHVDDAQRLRRSEQAEAAMRQVFDHVGEGLCMFNSQHRLVAWNARMVELSGLPPERVQAGLALADIVHNLARLGAFGTADPQGEAARRLAAFARPQPAFGHARLPDGRVVEMRSSPMPDGGFTVLAVDVTERRRSEKALAEHRAMLALLLQNTEEGVWTIDNALKTVDANAAMARMLGLTRDELMGRSIYDFVDTENAAVFDEQVHRRDLGLPGSYQIALRRADGTLVHTQNNPTPLFDAHGGKIGAIGLFTDITPLKQAAEELARTSEQLAAKTRVLESTLDSLAQGVLAVGPEGRVDAWNARVLQMLQLPESLLARRPLLREVVAHQIEHGLLPPSAGTPDFGWRVAAERYAGGDTTVLWSAPLYQRALPDGRVVEVQLHPAAGGGHVRTYSDVTQRVQAQRALAASEARFRSMADAAAAFIWQSDVQGHAVWFNQMWLQRVGRTLGQALAEPWSARIHPAHLPDWEQAFAEAVADARPFQVEYRLLAADGQECWLSDRGIPHLNDSGQFDGYVVYGWDVTARRAAEHAAVAARDEAERANRAKSEFLSRMSHELRTPLNAMLGFAQLIERDPAEPPRPHQRERVRQILQGGRHLMVLINEVLDLARIESGSLPLQIEGVAVAPLVADCRRLLDPMAREREVHLHLRPPPAPGLVRADATRLQQVLLNLLSNAIKYNHHGGDVVLSYSALPGHLRIEVSDTGPGLSDEQQQRLFQAFERLDADLSAVEGAGIGLALSKALVDLMQGHIGVRSAAGQGSTFWVELPLASAPAPASAPAVATPRVVVPELPEHPQGRRWQVMYIEDNLVNQLLVQGMLAHLPQVQLALSDHPHDGLQRLREAPPDLLLLDIQLPAMDGFQVLEALRADPTLADMPVVAVSANAMAADLQRARAAGFDHYLTKPLELSELLGVVSERLRLGRTPPA